MSRPETPVTGPLHEERFARDLTSLLSLPAFWSGQDPLFVVHTLLEALEAVLPVAASYVSVVVEDGPPLALLRSGGRPADPAEARWQPLVACATAVPVRESIHRIEIDATPLTVARTPLGYVGERGCVVVASAQQTFRSATEQMTLRAALTLAASGLEIARIIQQRDRAQRAKDEFLAMLGHELRNPLAPILTALKLMELRAGGHRSREHQVIERQVGQLRTLVDDLLDISRIARGQLDLRREPTDVADLLASAAETAAPLVDDRRHCLAIDVGNGLVIDADRPRLTQAFSNLLGNAAKYTPPGGTITVRAAAHDAGVEITISDTGNGIAPDLLPRVFDLFVQGSRDPARSGGGLGIGLTLVKTLVEGHGGTVAASSPGVGKGSVFTVRLPLATQPMTGASPEAMAPVTAQPQRILVVDDNRDAAELSAALLSSVGHDVRIAHTAAEATAMAASWVADLVFLDIGLPDADGYAVAERIRQLRVPAPRFVVMSGYGQAHDRERSRRAGFEAHLIKPVEPERLLAAVISTVTEPAT